MSSENPFAIIGEITGGRPLHVTFGEQLIPDGAGVWRVEGLRSLGAGASMSTLATAFGRTEAEARAWYHRHVNKPTPPGTMGSKLPIWTDAELTFTREPSE